MATAVLLLFVLAEVVAVLQREDLKQPGGSSVLSVDHLDMATSVGTLAIPTLQIDPTLRSPQ